MIKFDIPNPDATELPHVVLESRAHQADLSIQALDQNNPERELIDAINAARPRAGAMNPHPAGHFLQKIGANRLVYDHYVFFFQMILGAQNPVHDIAIAGQ
jgi:hypothetical protein